MTTSVPQVRSIEDLKWHCAKIMELAYEAVQLTGKFSHLETAMPPVRAIYQELKLRANLGTYDRDYVEQLGRALDKLEGIIAKHTQVTP